VSEKKTFILAHAEARRRAALHIQQAPDGYVVEVREPTRNSSQNALMWVLLQSFSEQLLWPVNGAMAKLAPDEWKAILSAAFCRESQRVAAGLDGGMVMLGMRTSQMGKRQFAEFIEFIHATAADRGVQLDEVPACQP
jgi:hypothetical protein